MTVMVLSPSHEASRSHRHPQISPGGECGQVFGLASTAAVATTYHPPLPSRAFADSRSWLVFALSRGLCVRGLWNELR